MWIGDWAGEEKHLRFVNKFKDQIQTLRDIWTSLYKPLHFSTQYYEPHPQYLQQSRGENTHKTHTGI